ncbi:DUF92 domain-containing protein [Candidatus Parabeggiatoa sp. HSG14]|uniref:DUF92 domain-containing protein n=1 Tax=Candidatus Parabeggiatoa sp. HSG14 TaxID=3055593 RepID=UPI0025A752FE|nr:DUF92 domain-containing protein [Thiotrichales bacterium HSG14]
MLTTQIIIGSLLAALISYLGWRFRALAISGALVATIIGGVIFGLGGLSWAMLLVTFFISSSGLSHIFSLRKTKLSEKFTKGSQRDWAQVLANGSLGVLLVITHVFFYPDQLWLWIAYAGAMATINADTWATELGVLSTQQPRFIITGQKVECGTSGGITFLGTFASLGGAVFIALVTAFFTPQLDFSLTIIVISLAGLTGSLLDSLLGATVQGIYECLHCAVETERHPRHTCGKKTLLSHGWFWFNNDVVNFVSSIGGAAIAVLFWYCFDYSFWLSTQE